MAERISNFGYLGVVRETTPGTALTPTDWIPLYAESLQTNANHVEDNPVIGNKWSRYQVIQGQRGHTGEFTVLAEPNTVARLFDMMMTKGSVTGSGPYTWPYTFAQADANSYTMDFSTGNTVFRFVGAQLSEIAPTFEGNEMRLKCKVSALKAFFGRTVATVVTNTITLDTTYDPSPTDGLVAGDLIAFELANGTVFSTTLTSITNGTTVVVAAATGVAAGDFLKLRPATPAYTLRAPFMWSRTQFCFGATASAALSAAQTRLEDGSNWSLQNNFDDDEGSKRSGAFDPASLVRTQADGEVKIKRFFDTGIDLKSFLSLTKVALVIRHFSETGFELRVTFNNLKVVEGAKPTLESGNVLYSEMTLSPVYDTTDAQAVDVKVINNLAVV